MGFNITVEDFQVDWHGRKLDCRLKKRPSITASNDILDLEVSLEIDGHIFQKFAIQKIEDDVESAKEKVLKKAIYKLEEDIRWSASGGEVKWCKEEMQREIDGWKQHIAKCGRKRNMAKWLVSIMEKENVS